MKTLKRILSGLLSLCLLLTLLPQTTLAVTEPEKSVSGTGSSTSDTTGNVIADLLGSGASAQSKPNVVLDNSTGTSVSIKEVTGLDLDLQKALEALGRREETASQYELTTYADDELVRVMVMLDVDSLLERGFTSQQIANQTAAVYKAEQKIAAAQAEALTAINAVVNKLALTGETLTVEAKYSYDTAFSGFSTTIPYGAINAVQELDGVAGVFVVPTFSLPQEVSAAGDVTTYTFSTTELEGAVQTWGELGYAGEGVQIAVIDTGLDVDHPSFSGDDIDLSASEDYLTLDDLRLVYTQLNAYEILGRSDALAADFYYNDKVPFHFNYVDESMDVTHDHDSMGDHGTHVCGIAAANDIDTTTVVGVAPEAQIIPMKVFGASGGAYFDDIIAALEDCFVLGVEVVNMSLGSAAGFSAADDASYEDVLAQILDTAMIVTVSAGNSYSAAYGNIWGTNTNLTSDPDNSTISSPATWTGTTDIASAENTIVLVNYILVDGEIHAYSDTTYVFATLMAPDGATEYEYVLIPGAGEAADFEGLDVEGKIAVIQRGDISFVDKQANAYDAGAVACIVYDNVDEDLIYMQDGGVIPNIFVTKATGEALVACADENGYGVLTVGDAEDYTPSVSSQAGMMSQFSSWGVSSDLTLEPDVTGYGGNIYSTYTDGQYGYMSGTSMSSPAVGGMSALLLQYLRASYDLNDTQMHTVAEALIMSTATPMEEYEGIYYSPRKQGAGVANIYDAIVSPVYLTVNGSTPKVSMGDDDEKTGVYTFTFELNNLSDRVQEYALEGQVLTDEVDLTYAEMGYYFMGETSRLLDAGLTFSVSGDTAALSVYDADGDGDLDAADVQLLLDYVNGVEGVAPVAEDLSYDLTGDDALDTADVQALYELVSANRVVAVPANGTATVTVTITLTDADKEYMDTYYENGIYVDCFIRCIALSEEAVDLSLPALAFYGDWSAARILDDAWVYYEEYVENNRYYNLLWTGFDLTGYYLGYNPYVDEPYDESHNVLSPGNEDGYQDKIDEIYLSMMRNAREIIFTWANAETGEVYCTRDCDLVRKSTYYEGYGVNYPFIYGNYYTDYCYDMKDADGNYLPSGTELIFTIDCWLDDGDDVIDETWSTVIYVDEEAPTVSTNEDELVYIETTDSRLFTFTASDNHNIAAIMTVNEANSIMDLYAVNGDFTEDGETISLTIDVSDYDSTFYLVVCDYGMHETVYQVNFSGKANYSYDRFYGYRDLSVYESDGYYYATSGYNGWVSFVDQPDVMFMNSAAYYDGNEDVMSAEYVEGYVVAADFDGNVFATKLGDWTDRYELGTINLLSDLTKAGTEFEQYYYEDHPVLDMALDITTGKLWMLTDQVDEEAPVYLVEYDYVNGEIVSTYLVDLEQFGTFTYEYTEEGETYSYTYQCQPLTLAIDNDGVMYSVALYSGDLYTLTVNETEGTVEASYVGTTGYYPQTHQSMTVDHKTNELYWAAYATYTGEALFLQIDKETGEAVNYTGVEYNSQITGLFKPYDSGDWLPVGEPQYMTISEEKMGLALNSSKSLTALVYPYYCGVSTFDMTWTSSDESVVTVEPDGTVTAVGLGEAVITVTYGDLEPVQCEISVVRVSAQLYACDNSGTLDESGYYQCFWMSFRAEDPSAVVSLPEANAGQDGILSAAYWNGSIYAFDYYGTFYRLDAETLTGPAIGSYNGGQITAMAFNYADGYLYGVESVSNWFNASYTLVRVNPSTGEVAAVMEMDSYEYPIASGGIAFDENGNLYMLGFDYNTYMLSLDRYTLTYADDTYDTVTGLELTGSAEVGELVYGNFNTIVYSMDNDCLFWADEVGNLKWIDPATLSEGWVSVVDLGGMGALADNGYAVTTAMVCIHENEPETFRGEPTSVVLPETYSVLAGGTISTGLTVLPWNAEAKATYAVEDETVATVSEDGIITGVTPGQTVLTATVEGFGDYTAVVKVLPSAGQLNGYLVSDFGYATDYWIYLSDTAPGDSYGTVGDYFSDFTVCAGAYYDGYVYAYAQDMQGVYNYKYKMLRVDVETQEYTILEVTPDCAIRDMAFDYSTGTMYALVQGGGYTGAIAQVDLTTGAVVVLAETGVSGQAMCCNAEGVLYVVDANGDLWSVNGYTGEASFVGNTGVKAHYYQSMHYDLNTGNVYWSQVSPDNSSSLRLVDLENGTTTSLGLIGPTGAMVSALYTVPAEENLPEVTEVQPSGIALRELATTLVGETVSLQASVLPLSVYAADHELVWTSADESIATVDENGVVTGVSAGEVEITVTLKGSDLSATCTVLVTAESRRFYTYDQSTKSWISFTKDDPSQTTVEYTEAEDATLLVSMVLAGDVIYAYDENGSFYAIDPDTYERSEAMNGLPAATVPVEVYDWNGNLYTEYVPVEPAVDLAYDSDSGKLYGVFQDSYGYGVYVLAEVDVTTGSIRVVTSGSDAIPANLLIKNGTAFFVDAYYTGVINSVNLTTGAVSEDALITGYWGYSNQGRGFYEDVYTGEVFAIRDFCEYYTYGYGLYGQSELVSITLSNGTCVEYGTIGELTYTRVGVEYTWDNESGTLVSSDLYDDVGALCIGLFMK